MIGIYLISAAGLCCLVLLVAYLYMRPNEIELHDKSVDLASVLPIQTITDDMIVNGNGDITVGYHMLLPEVFSLSESKAATIHKQLQAMCKELPSGTVIHQQSFIYTGKYHDESYSSNSLTVENQKYFNDKEILNNYVNIYFSFPDKPSRCPPEQYGKLTDQEDELSFQAPVQKLRKTIRES